MALARSSNGKRNQFYLLGKGPSRHIAPLLEALRAPLAVLGIVACGLFVFVVGREDTNDYYAVVKSNTSWSGVISGAFGQENVSGTGNSYVDLPDDARNDFSCCVVHKDTDAGFLTVSVMQVRGNGITYTTGLRDSATATEPHGVVAVCTEATRVP